MGVVSMEELLGLTREVRERAASAAPRLAERPLGHLSAAIRRLAQQSRERALQHFREPYRQ